MPTELEALDASTAGDSEPLSDDTMQAFGQMGARAVFATGVYWNKVISALEAAKLGGYAKQLKEMKPITASITYAWLKQIERDLRGGRQLATLYLKEAEALRSFTPTIRIVQGDDLKNELVVPERWIALHTDILERFPVSIGKDGNSVVRIPGRLVHYRRGEGEYGSYFRTARLPGGGQCKIERFPVDEYCKQLGRLAAQLSQKERRAIKVLESLVRSTGIVPYDDDMSTIPAEALSGIC